MKKFWLIAPLAAVLALSACTSSGGNVQNVIDGIKAACGIIINTTLAETLLARYPNIAELIKVACGVVTTSTAKGMPGAAASGEIDFGVVPGTDIHIIGTMVN